MPIFFWLVECETEEKIRKGSLERQEDQRGPGECSIRDAKRTEVKKMARRFFFNLLQNH